MNTKGFVGLLGLLLTVGIICFMAYFTLKQYFGKPPMDQQTQDAAKQAGIDTSSQQGIVDSVRSTVKDIEASQLHQSQQMMNSLGRY